jgi:hypothetical protein
MKKESAKSEGPKLIITNQQHYGISNEQIITKLLLADHEEKFDCNQAIIVRNEKAKSRLN